MAILKSSQISWKERFAAPKDPKTEKDGLDLMDSVKSVTVKLILQLHFKSSLMQVFKSSKGLTKEFQVPSGGGFPCSKQPGCNPPAAEDKGKSPFSQGQDFTHTSRFWGPAHHRCLKSLPAVAMLEIPLSTPCMGHSQSSVFPAQILQ